jgi:hypothetical protein
MGKKIVSYVLACLISVVFSVSVFAAAGGTVGAIDTGPTGELSTGSINAGNHTASGLAARISTVFNYTSGILTSVSSADGSISIYDAGKHRATYKPNDAGGYDLSSLSLYGTDKVEDIKALAISLGASENQFKGGGSAATSAENTASVNSKEVSWLGTALDHLKGGINQSISINFEGEGGATVTLNTNGQPQKTLSYDGTEIQTYNYDKNGFLSSVDSLVYEHKNNNGTIEVDKTGKKQTTYYVGGKATGVKDANGNVIQTFTYDAIGNLQTTYNKESQTTTHYGAGGKVVSTTNAENSVTSNYYYNLNGTMDYISSSAGKTKEGGDIPASATVFHNNKAIASYAGNTTSPSGIRQAYLKAVDAVLAGDTAAATNVYNSIKTMGATFMWSPGVLQAVVDGGQAGKNFEAFAIISGLPKSVKVQAKDAEGNGKTTSSTSTREENGFNNTYTTLTPVLTETNPQKDLWDAVVLSMKYSNNISTAMSTSYSLNPAGEGHVSSVGDTYVSSVSVYAHGQQSVVLDFSIQNPPEATTSLTTSTPIPQDTSSGSSDPVVTGTVEAVITGEEAAALGLDPNKTYVQVEADFIDVMDENGGEDVAGETIFVEVTTEVAERMKEGESVMFMGDVSTESTTGKFVLTMNVNYGGGYVTGEEAVNARKETYMNEQWAMDNRAANSSFFQQTFGSAVIDWQTGWQALVNARKTADQANVKAMF